MFLTFEYHTLDVIFLTNYSSLFNKGYVLIFDLTERRIVDHGLLYYRKDAFESIRSSVVSVSIYNVELVATRRRASKWKNNKRTGNHWQTRLHSLSWPAWPRSFFSGVDVDVSPPMNTSKSRVVAVYSVYTSLSRSNTETPSSLHDSVRIMLEKGRVTF